MEQNVNLGFLGFWFSVEKEKTPGHKVTKWFNRQAISHAAPDGARDMFGCTSFYKHFTPNGVRIP